MKYRIMSFILSDTDRDNFLKYFTGSKKIVIPQITRCIGPYAFQYNDTLEELEIPNSVESIGEYAFFKCTSLISITIPDSVTSIGSDAFYDCSSLTSIIFNGTTEQWILIQKGSNWNPSGKTIKVICLDGEVEYD